MDYITAKKIFDNHDYTRAFSAFRSVAEDQGNDLTTRANAFNMMGVIVTGFSPDLDIEDESGIRYFIKAIELDAHNIGALLNIVESYEDSTFRNNMLSVFKTVCERLLNELSNSITTEQLSKVRIKYGKFF